MTEPPDDEALIAYLDGEAADPAEIEAWLGRDPALSRRLQVLSEATAAIRESFEEILREPVPERLLLAATTAPTGEILGFLRRLPLLAGLTIRVPRHWAGLAAAASICGILFGGSMEYLAQGDRQSNWLDNVAGYHNLIISSANSAYDPVFDVSPGSEQKLPVDIRVPDLKPWNLGFQGARTIMVEGKTAYQFFYATDDKALGPISLTVVPSAKADTLPTFDHRDGLNVMYWRHGGRSYAIVGHDANKGYMWGLAQDIAWQMSQT
jgi:anti-sigma factor RsiW